MRDLVERAQGGDREAFGALVGMISDRLYGLAARILRDNDLAEDALQGALISAWRQLPALRDPDRVEGWVRKVLVHACYAESRRRTRWAANIRVLEIEGSRSSDDSGSVADRDELEPARGRLLERRRRHANRSSSTMAGSPSARRSARVA